MAYQGLAAAKVNLSLDIVGQRQDGYHLLRSVMQTISLSDVVTVELAGKTSLTVTDSLLVCDETNLAWQAFKLLDDEFGLDAGVAIKLEKHIPLGGGMAGGSTDAAQVLLAVSLNWGYRWMIWLAVQFCWGLMCRFACWAVRCWQRVWESSYPRLNPRRNCVWCWYIRDLPCRHRQFTGSLMC